MPLKKIFICTGSLFLVIFILSFHRKSAENALPPSVLSESGFIKDIDGYVFRDLNKNGKLDVYEDVRQPVELRIKDLLKQMTLEEKIGRAHV